MAHLKRQQVSTSWPLSRKGTTFVVKAASNSSTGIPMLVALRDMIKIAQNKKEVKKAIHDRNILLNDKPVNDEKIAITLSDIVTIIPTKTSYKLSLSQNGKFKLIETKETGSKIAKVSNKITIKGKKTQLNLSDGKNYISDLKCKTNDSVIVDFAKRNVTKCLEFKEKAKILVFAGKHTGAEGVIKSIDTEKKVVEATIGENTVNVLIKQLMVIA